MEQRTSGLRQQTEGGCVRLKFDLLGGLETGLAGHSSSWTACHCADTEAQLAHQGTFYCVP